MPRDDLRTGPGRGRVVGARGPASRRSAVSRATGGSATNGHGSSHTGPRTAEAGRDGLTPGPAAPHLATPADGNDHDAVGYFAVVERDRIRMPNPDPLVAGLVEDGLLPVAAIRDADPLRRLRSSAPCPGPRCRRADAASTARTIADATRRNPSRTLVILGRERNVNHAASRPVHPAHHAARRRRRRSFRPPAPR